MNKKKTILIIDDDVELIQIWSEMLKLKNYSVIPIPKPKYALKVIKTKKFDLIITDINMPEMDGIEFIREIKKYNKKQNIIVMTGFPTPFSQQETFKLGVLHYIIKPFSLDRLSEIINKIFNQNSNTDNINRKDREKKLIKKEEKMPSQAQEILTKASGNIDGLEAIGIIGMDGIPIAVNNPSNTPWDTYSAKYAVIMSMIKRTLVEIKTGEMEETLIEHGNGWVLSRFIGKSKFFLTVVVSKSAVLGNVRMVARQIEDQLKSVIS